jgi:hypothetical protein
MQKSVKNDIKRHKGELRFLMKKKATSLAKDYKINALK